MMVERRLLHLLLMCLLPVLEGMSAPPGASPSRTPSPGGLMQDLPDTPPCPGNMPEPDRFHESFPHIVPDQHRDVPYTIRRVPDYKSMWIRKGAHRWREQADVVEKQKIGIYGEKGTVCVGTWQLFEGSAGRFGQVCCATSATGLLDQTMLVEGGTSEEPWRFEECDILCDVGISMRLIENAHVGIDNSTLGGLPNPLPPHLCVALDKIDEPEPIAPGNKPLGKGGDGLVCLGSSNARATNSRFVRSGLSNRGARFDESSRGRIASCAFSLLGFGVFSSEKADVTVVSSEFEDLQYAAFGGNPNGSQAVLRIGGNTVKGREWYAVLKPAAVEVLEEGPTKLLPLSLMSDGQFWEEEEEDFEKASGGELWGRGGWGGDEGMSKLGAKIDEGWKQAAEKERQNAIKEGMNATRDFRSIFASVEALFPQDFGPVPEFDFPELPPTSPDDRMESVLALRGQYEAAEAGYLKMKAELLEDLREADRQTEEAFEQAEDVARESEKLRWAEMQKREGWTEEFYLENEVVM